MSLHDRCNGVRALVVVSNLQGFLAQSSPTLLGVYSDYTLIDVVAVPVTLP